MSAKSKATLETVGRRKLLQTGGAGNQVVVSNIVVVSQNGSGNFTKITDAINFAPTNSAPAAGYFVVYITAGVYEEYVNIPQNKKYLMMIGDGINQTVITENHSVVDGWTTFDSATFTNVDTTLEHIIAPHDFVGAGMGAINIPQNQKYLMMIGDGINQTVITGNHSVFDGWTTFDSATFSGIYLLEVHRILHPGGFWVLSGPPINYQHRWRGWNTTIEDQKSDYGKLEELLTSMCFKLYNKKDDIAVWQKTTDNDRYKQLDVPDNYPPKCDDGTEPDSAWYTPLRPCVVVPKPKLKKLERIAKVWLKEEL